jgi:hypothetical protein
MEKSERKIGKVFLVFAWCCIVALPLVVYTAFSYEPEEVETTVVEPQSLDFDQGSISGLRPTFRTKSKKPI